MKITNAEAISNQLALLQVPVLGLARACHEDNIEQWQVDALVDTERAIKEIRNLWNKNAV